MLKRARLELEPLRGYIESALLYADYSHDFSDICDMIDAGQLTAWPAAHSIIITEILAYPRYSAINFFLAGGDIAELEDMYKRIEVFARFAGCDRAVMTGRKGWERSFLTKREGWGATLEVFEKKF